MGVMTEADVRAAQAVLDAWNVPAGAVQITVDAASLLELRGIIAGQFADVRTAGYLEGMQRGRQEAAHVVLDALRGEGLAP